MSNQQHEAVTPILLPQAGNTMEEGTILEWRVSPGDRVRPGQVLFELETDKATIEVEAEAEGRVAKILVPAGQSVPVKTVVALLAEDDAAAERFAAQTLDGAPAVGESAAEPPEPPAQVPSEPRPAPQPTRRKASPAARAAAAALGVDLEAVPQGSGPGGRILREDVERAAALSRPAAPVAAGRPQPPALQQPTSAGERRPLSKMRRAIARNLAASKQQLPHWYLRTTLVADNLVAFHKREKALYPCSLNDVVVLAVARAILEMPEFRSRLEGDEVVTFDSVNIGLAVAVDEGLVVPVVRGVDRMNLKGLAAESRRVVEAARQGRLEGVGEGVFTVSNLGMFGVEEFAAIINPPEVGILAVGAVREEVIVQDGAMRPGRKMTLTLSADHRLIDGVTGARFMARVKELLEDPASWA